MCNGLVRFALRHDKQRVFKYATLQGDTAQKLIPGFIDAGLKSVVLLDEKGTHTESRCYYSPPYWPRRGFETCLSPVDIAEVFSRRGLPRDCPKSLSLVWHYRELCTLIKRRESADPRIITLSFV